MDFNKIISEMQELQSKIELYELKSKYINDAISCINKEIIKLEKKSEKEQNELEKYILNIRILIMRQIMEKFDFKN